MFGALVNHFYNVDTQDVTVISPTLLDGYTCQMISAAAPRAEDMGCIGSCGLPGFVYDYTGSIDAIDAQSLQPAGGAVHWSVPTSKQYASHHECMIAYPQECPVPDANMHLVEPNFKLFETAGYQISSVPAVAGGVVFFTSQDSFLYAVDATTRNQLWKFNVKGGSYKTTSPVVANGAVFCGTGYYVYAIDASTGAQMWRFALDISTRSHGYASSPAVVGGVVFVGIMGVFETATVARYFHAIEASSGAELWKFRCDSSVSSSPAVVGGVAYIGSLSGSVYAIDVSSGKELWRFRGVSATGGGPVSSSPAVVGGVVYFGVYVDNLSNQYSQTLDQTYLFAVDASSGELLWKRESGGAGCCGVGSSTPAVVGGVAYYGSYGHLYAFNASTGSQQWKFGIGDIGSAHQGSAGRAGSPAVADGVVYVGSTDSFLYAVDASSGALLWRYEIGVADDYTALSPTVADGVVYIGSNKGFLYAIWARGVAPDGQLKLWEFADAPYGSVSSGKSESFRGAAVVANGVVYVSVGVLGTLAIDASSGRQLWNYNSEDTVVLGSASRVIDQQYISPAVADDGVVYIAISRDYYYGTGPVQGLRQIGVIGAINATTGSELWTFETIGEVWSPPAVAGGVAYACCKKHYVYAINASTGSQLWKTDIGSDNGGFETLQVATDGVVYVASIAHQEPISIYALDASTGRTLWMFSNITGYDFSSLVLADGVIYISTDAGHLYAVNASAGSQLWKFDMSDRSSMYFYSLSSGLPSPAVVRGVVYVWGGDMHSGLSLYAVDAKTRSQLWKFQPGGYGDRFSTPVFASGVVYVSLHSSVYALDASSGRQIWKFQGTNLHVPVVADGVVYIASSAKIFALKAPLWFASRSYCAVTGVRPPNQRTGISFDAGKIIVLESSASSILSASGLDSTAALEDCRAQWSARVCNVGTLTGRFVREQMCSPLKATAAEPNPNPPYSCTRTKKRDLLEAVSLGYGFAEPAYLLVMFLICRWLWKTAVLPPAAGKGPFDDLESGAATRPDADIHDVHAEVARLKQALKQVTAAISQGGRGGGSVDHDTAAETWDRRPDGSTGRDRCETSGYLSVGGSSGLDPSGLAWRSAQSRRDRVEALLLSDGSQGSFVVRPSSRRPDVEVLSFVKGSSNVDHIEILKNTDCKVHLRGKTRTFDAVADLVHYYARDGITDGLPVTLRMPDCDL